MRTVEELTLRIPPDVRAHLRVYFNQLASEGRPEVTIGIDGVVLVDSESNLSFSCTQAEAALRMLAAVFPERLLEMLDGTVN